MSRINTLSITPGLTPNPEKLNIAQIAINAADGKLFIKLLSGVVICVGGDVSKFATKAQLEQSIEGIDLSDYALADTVAQSLTAIAQQLQGLSNSLAGKASIEHSHSIPQVTGLGETLSSMQSAINGKQPSGNYAAAGQVDGLQNQVDAIIAAIQNHGHTISQIDGLANALADKASLTMQTVNFTNIVRAGVFEARTHIIAGTEYRIGADRVIRAANRNGWQAATGPTSTAAFNTQSATLSDVAKRLGAVINELRYHGLLSSMGNTIA